MINRFIVRAIAILGLAVFACNLPVPAPQQTPGIQPLVTAPGPQAESASNAPTPLPTRPAYKPGEQVDYTAQSGDTLPALAARFNTTVPEIMAANPIIPSDATTMPRGLPMKIPIYFKALWASPYKMIPDSAFVNGPAQIGFNTSAFVASQFGWLKEYRAYAGGQYRSGAEIVDYVATNFSISPRLLLALLEYEAGALSQPAPPTPIYVLGFKQQYYETVYLQLVWAANTLNNGYYSWRAGSLTEFDQPDGALVRADPWQNAASVGIQYLFSRLSSGAVYDEAVGPAGFAKTFESLFGDPWAEDIDAIPVSLRQPALYLPFPPGQVWTFTGGPHTGWGKGQPFAAVDFAPPSEHHGCFTVEPQNFAVAMADGLVARSSTDGLMLDLDGDGDERTGWDVFYLHLDTNTRARLGQQLHAGDFIGYPSCRGGEATGTHIHIARKYNGEWIIADGLPAFEMEGWTVHSSGIVYQGTLTRGGLTVRACDCSDSPSEIRADPGP
jgi:murein DD-endopeptidase MepM/ murein hydrolase activator NlpD